MTNRAYRQITAKRVAAGDRITSVLGYPEATLTGEVLDVRPSPGGGCMILTLAAGELMLYPTDTVDVERPQTTCGYHGDDTTSGRCSSCDSLEVVPRSQWDRLRRHGYATFRSTDGHPQVLRLTDGGTALVPVLIGA